MRSTKGWRGIMLGRSYVDMGAPISCAGSGRPPSERQVASKTLSQSAPEIMFLALARDGVVYEWGWDWRLEELIQRPELYEFDEPDTDYQCHTGALRLESGRGLLGIAQR